jgi:formylglycine-generating enzyme required for sulfatase activity
MGVYEVTQRQWEMVGTRSKPSYWNNTTDWEARPVEQVSYYDIRSSASGNVAVAGTDWPNNGHAVGEGSFMGILRATTGWLLEFALPTEAQWEYACRAGTTGPWNNGVGASGSDTDANLTLLGRYQYNGGMTPSANWPQDCLASNATAKAGTYLPNAWGLYDMHGNVFEWCLDYYITGDATLSGGDPVGPSLAVGSARVRRGGGWNYGASYCRSARRRSNSPSTRYSYIGFRVAAPAVVWITQ